MGELILILCGTYVTYVFKIKTIYTKIYTDEKRNHRRFNWEYPFGQN